MLSSLSRASEVLIMAHFVSKLTVFKLPTAKLDFIDFLQIEAAFLKTNYITFSYLPIATDEQNISEKKNFGSGHEISVLLDFYRHWLLNCFDQFLS